MWSSVESGGLRAAPCARGKHSATLLGGHVYVLGGRGAGGSVPLRDFWRYSLATGAWERLQCRGEAPPSLQEHSATAHAGRLYVFGGEAGALSNETPLWIYDTETQNWRKLPGQSTSTSTARRREARDPRGGGAGPRGASAGPRGRRGHSAHALKDCLLIYGGYKDLRGSTNELWAFHYESESWQQVRTGGAGGAGAGPARHRHAAALHGDRLYVHAGQCDLRDCADLWHYDTMSRVWSQVRASRAAPAARSGHAAARAGAHLYIFGGETHGHSSNDMWRFHFGTESWERILPTLKWPSPRVDGRALLVGAAGRSVGGGESDGEGARTSRAAARSPPASLLRELSRLSSFHLRRAARCSYSALAPEQDSTESLLRQEAALAKSHSAYVIDARGGRAGGRSPRAADEAPHRADMPREPLSVPDFTDMVLSPAAGTELVYVAGARGAGGARGAPQPATVRFATDSADDDAELSTSDYASAEGVNGLTGATLAGAALGFSNPHYLGPDVRALGQALTPDSGVGAGDIELQELGARRGPPAAPPQGAQLHLLLVGGREPPHVALLQSPLSMWTYRLL